jgi:hypothetical protein
MSRYILVTCYGNNFRNCPFSATKYLFGNIELYTVVEEILKVISTGFAYRARSALTRYEAIICYFITEYY